MHFPAIDAVPTVGMFLPQAFLPFDRGPFLSQYAVLREHVTAILTFNIASFVAWVISHKYMPVPAARYGAVSHR